MKKKLAVLGCTGSIGRQTLEVVRSFPDRFEVAGLSAHQNRAGLEKAAAEFSCTNTCLSGDESSDRDGLKRLIESSGADMVVNGVAGSAGLLPSVWTLEAGIDLALANKETMVMAGPVIKALGAKTGARILPVDSEHSAVFQLLARLPSGSLSEVLLTASGGPFREMAPEDLAKITLEDALKHPTWQMGPQITVDSATLANKGLEVIEAHFLFDVPPERIKVLVHPQSIVHSLVRTKDGVLYGQASKPDMRHPILAALTWPEVLTNALQPLELGGQTLTFYPPRTDAFPMLPLAYMAIEAGLPACIAYNLANEAARNAFIAGRAKWHDIPRAVEAAMHSAVTVSSNALTNIEGILRFSHELTAKLTAEALE